jgi:branched-chain amino acid transport system permease protein
MAFINYLIHLAILVCIYAMLTVSLNLAIGFTGLINLGHIAFFGIGAYTSAILAMHGFPLWLCVLGAAIAAMLAGIILAIPTTRLKGDYLALATLGFTFITGSIARNWVSLTRGPLGIPGIPKYVRSNEHLLLIALGTALAIAGIIWLISRSRFGRTLQAVRDDELAAKMLGRNTALHKIAALGISAFFAGIAGSFFAHYISFLDPSIFSIGDLVLLVAMVIVGGLASVKGSLIGAAIILLIPEPLRFIGFSSALIGPMREMLFALILLLILIYRPKGLFGKVDLQ